MGDREAGLLHESLRLAGDRGRHLRRGLLVRRARQVDHSLHGVLHRHHVPDVHVCADEDFRRRRLHHLVRRDLLIRSHQRADPAGDRVHQRVHGQRVGLPVQRGVHGHSVHSPDVCEAVEQAVCGVV